MGEYVSRYAVPIPGDWPAQFHVRNAVYSRCGFEPPANVHDLENTHGSSNDVTSMYNNDGLHQYSMSATNDCFTNIDDGHIADPLQSAVPMIGPLHISVNSREDVMQNFHPFFKHLHENLFPKQKLAEKPKPGRTSLFLEVVYGGWTLIRPSIKQSFGKCKHPLYGILFSLLDNYISLVLSIYSVVFRFNSFPMYLSSMISLWVMFYCFPRYHNNKAALVWLSNVLFWKRNNRDMYRFLQRHITTTDEYPVENTHSIIRAQTTDGNDASMLQKKPKQFSNPKNISIISVLTSPRQRTTHLVKTSYKISKWKHQSNLLKFLPTYLH